MAAASQFSFLKNPSDEERRAVGSGCRAGALARSNQGEGVMGKSATRHRGTKFVPRGDYVPNKVETTAESFAATILPFQRKVVARIAGVTPDTVKAWRKARQVPRAEHIFRMAQSIPAVRNWALGKLGVNEMPEFMSPQALTTMMACAYQVMHQHGPDGDAARAQFAKMQRGE